MIVDSSAFAAILFKEAEASRCAGSLEAAGASAIRMSTATRLELAVVLHRKGLSHLEPTLDRMMAEASVDLVPFTASQLAIARDAFARFGKGNHPARLNFGDCFAYALAKELGEPLLFVGEDFSQTDIAAA